MPALIVFSTGQSGSKADRLRVTEDSAAVVDKLGASKTGFADFTVTGETSATVWINRDQVRMVRDFAPTD
jgi:hypothetical protein